jgi:hypothetical protein
LGLHSFHVHIFGTMSPSPPPEFSHSSPRHAPPTLLRKPRKKWTHTNTDKECLRDDASWLRRWIYTIDIHNGFKFFNLLERTALHVVVWFCVATIATYSYVFLQGLYDGLTAPDHGSVAADTEALE